MSDLAISVKNLSKRYRLGLQEKVPDTFVGALSSWLKSPLANYRQLHKLSDFRDDPLDQEGHELGATPEDVLYALRDVSFDIKKGEVVGIIGRNGAGKSTLLKILSRITEPTSGRVEVHGRVASLLEVGTGFHPELTGRENIYLNGTILGMRKAEIDRNFDEIVAFSEVEKFLDTPVKRYSSGMYVRLAFAVAAHLEPEILIVDEVLAVGDAAFQKKCLKKIGDVATAGRTVIFVSHNMQAVNSLCSNAILLAGGRCSLRGEVKEVVGMYLSENNRPSLMECTFEGTDSLLNLVGIRVYQPGNPHSNFVTSKPICIELTIKANGVKGDDLICGFTVFDEQSSPVFSTYFNEFGDALAADPIFGTRCVKCVIPANFLNEGRLEATVDVGIAKVRRVTTDDVHRFTLELSNVDGLGARYGLGRTWRRGPILPLIPWEYI